MNVKRVNVVDNHDLSNMESIRNKYVNVKRNARMTEGGRRLRGILDRSNVLDSVGSSEELSPSSCEDFLSFKRGLYKEPFDQGSSASSRRESPNSNKERFDHLKEANFLEFQENSSDDRRLKDVPSIASQRIRKRIGIDAIEVSDSGSEEAVPRIFRKRKSKDKEINRGKIARNIESVIRIEIDIENEIEGEIKKKI